MRLIFQKIKKKKKETQLYVTTNKYHEREKIYTEKIECFVLYYGTFNNIPTLAGAKRRIST